MHRELFQTFYQSKLNLLKRGIGEDKVCSICSLQYENVEHILKDCGWSSRLWLLYPLEICIDAFVGVNFAFWLYGDILSKGFKVLEQTMMLS